MPATRRETRHLAAMAQQLIGEMGADEAGTAGDENLSAHISNLVEWQRRRSEIFGKLAAQAQSGA
jgi:hypothetical protein